MRIHLKKSYLCLYNISINEGMVKALKILMISMIAVIITSCMEKENYGYPSKINFTADGDTLSLIGSEEYAGYVSSLELLNYDGEGGTPSYDAQSGTTTVTTQWLTVSLSLTENKMQLIAEPNGTKKTRKLYLYLNSGRGSQEITVQQSK